MTTDIDYGAFDALTFDCYGTLIDWETGLLAGLRTVLAAHGVDGTDDELLEAYAGAEATLENVRISRVLATRFHAKWTARFAGNGHPVSRRVMATPSDRSSAAPM